MSSAYYRLITDAAGAYSKETGVDIPNHPFAIELQVIDSPDAIFGLLDVKAKRLNQEGGSNLTGGLRTIVYISHAFSGALGEAVSLASLPPAKMIFVAVYILLTAASTIPSGYDALVDIFEVLGQFLSRLRIYADVPLSPSRLEIILKLMMELLFVFGFATKQIKQGRFKELAKKLLGESEIEAVLQRLDRLTPEEHRMTVAQTLEVVLGLVKNVKIVMNDGTASTDGILKALDTMEQITSDVDKMRRDQLQKDTRHWLCPPDPSKNYNIGLDAHHEGTATWFYQGSVFTEWCAKGSLLWVHGRPGSGKSVLLSTIIRDIHDMCRAGLASMAYYYFDFRDDEKRHLRGLLSSLVFQLGANSDPCYQILYRLYLDHAGGVEEPPEDTLSQCLAEMLMVPGQPAMYIVLDALDECPNISGMPTPREQVLEFLEHLVKLELPNLHICVSSRPEFDIRYILEPLASFSVSLHDESGQNADIFAYIDAVVNSDRKMRNWREEDRQLVIDTLSDKADGMFRWVFCQLEVLRRTLPAHIRSALDDMPKTLDETYVHVLLGIDGELRPYTQRLFQCLAVSIRPLRVEELADILAVRFDAEAQSKFNPDWRLGEDAEEAVLSVCSSLVSVIDMDGSQLVQFSHFSVKEFLTSDRLASSEEALSVYHIAPDSAHTFLAQASLSVLLHLDDGIDKDGIKNFPLSGYAAKHWVEHAQFGNVTSSSIQAAMEQLLNPDKPHFSAWVWIYDMDDPRRGSIPTIRPSPPQASPLYYAVLCGFRGLIEHLVVTYPMVVDATGGYYGSPLFAAVIKEDIDTALLLLRRGADIHAVGTVTGWAPLQIALLNGSLEVAEMLLGCGADITVRGRNGETPLDLASGGESAEVVSFLVQRGADVKSCDNNGWTPLHTASTSGNISIVQVLLNEGADVEARNADSQTSLALASENGAVDVSYLLIECGAYINSSDNKGRTPLCSASRLGHLEVVRLLLDYGADVNLQGVDLWSPLHLATANGHLKVVGLLIQYDADVDGRNENRETALNLASRSGELEIARLLLKCGSKVNSQDNKGWTPLHSALRAGNFDVARLLLEWGADTDLLTLASDTPLDLASGDGKHEVAIFLGERKGQADTWNSRDLTPANGPSRHWQIDLTHSSESLNHGEDGRNSDETTPMHAAARRGHLPILRSLRHKGTDVDDRNANHETSLAVASSVGRLDVVSWLIDSGAEVNSRCDAGWTPLHRASQYGHFHIVRLLLDHGAKVNVREQERWTPLHLASYNGHLEIVHLLLERGADIHARNFGGWTPLHAASASEHVMITLLLSEYGANEDIEVVASPREPTPSTPNPAHYAFLLQLLALLLAYLLRRR